MFWKLDAHVVSSASIHTNLGGGDRIINEIDNLIDRLKHNDVDIQSPTGLVKVAEH